MKIVIEGVELPPHTSYSSFTSFLSCPKAWYFARVLKAPERPAWYFAGGSAVHAATEDYDREVTA